jgi:anti-sigma regulatory factor (Ser/Thr protein kinase)
LGSLALLCAFVSISVFFSVNLFGKRWSDVTFQTERSSVHLRSALDNVAHDFRSIVQSLRTELRLLKALGSLELLSDMVGRLSRTIGQFDLITDDFRASVLGKIGGDTSPTKVELFLPFVVRHVVEYHNSRRFSEGSTIRASCSPDSASSFVMAHLAQINRLLGNLIDNSVEACRDVSTKLVVVSLARDADNAVIRVSDSGIGIDPEHIDSVFESSFTTKGDNRGQGLTSCRQIVEDLGGTVAVEKSQVGVGTTIKVSLPTTPRPPWFLDRVVVDAEDILVFIDDEEDMQDVWRARIQERFSSICAMVNGAALHPVLNFVSDPAELRSPSNTLLSRGTKFFVDFRLKNYHIDGLSLIKEYGIQNRSILVTNHFHDLVILKRAVELGVPVLPKEFLSEVSFDLELGGTSAANTAVSDRR